MPHAPLMSLRPVVHRHSARVLPLREFSGGVSTHLMHSDQKAAENVSKNEVFRRRAGSGNLHAGGKRVQMISLGRGAVSVTAEIVEIAGASQFA